MKIEPTDKIIDCKNNETVKNDLAPIVQGLVDCFICIEQKNPRQYKNNLIMLKYYCKGFEEVCKE